MEDELLNQLALEAKQLTLQANQNLSRNLQRQRALNRLLTQIVKSKRLARPQQGQWEPVLYEDLWNEARSRTMLEIAERIEAYNPEYAILAWVNKTLNYRFKDVVQDFYRGGMTGVPRPNGDSNPFKVRSLDEFDQERPAEPDEPDLLRQFIIDDPEKQLTDHIRGRPKATFRFLLLARLEEQSWDEISAILGPPSITKQTLCSFFNRQLRERENYFQKYLNE